MRHEVFGHIDPAALGQVPLAVDEKDVHVASAALTRARAADPSTDKVFLVTANLDDLPPAALSSLGITALSPGAFIDALHGAAPERVARALAKAIADLKDPPYTAAELLGALVLHGAAATVKTLSRTWRVAPEKKRRRPR